MKAKTFAELEKAEIVTLEELQTSLEDYAAGGWAILSQVVKKLVDKMDPSFEEMDILIRSASKGLDIQTKRRAIREVGEYQDLLYYLQGKSFAKYHRPHSSSQSGLICISQSCCEQYAHGT